MVLKEYRKEKKDSKVEIKSIDTQLGKLKHRRGKLYNVLETGKLDIDDMASRLKELNNQIDNLLKKEKKIFQKK